LAGKNLGINVMMQFAFVKHASGEREEIGLSIVLAEEINRDGVEVTIRRVLNVRSNDVWGPRQTALIRSIKEELRFQCGVKNQGAELS
jgi:hypothetical protein